ncbi:MAG: PAS domain S-box protein [Polyangiales bacterium]
MRVPVVARGRSASPKLCSALRALGHVPVEVDPRGLLSLVADLTLPSVVVFDGASRDLATDLADLRATPVGALVPTLVALDEADTPRALACIEAGADDVLTPPITDDAVRLRLAALLRRALPPREAWVDRVDRGLVSTVLDALACPVVVTSRAGVVEHFNRESEALSAVSSSEVLGTRRWRSLVPPDEAERFDEVHARVVAGDASVEYEGDRVARDGERHRIAWRVSSLRDAAWRGGARPRRGIDVTERERARRELAASESTLRSLFDSAPFIMGIVERGEDSPDGPEYTIVAGNGAFSRTFGISPRPSSARARDLPFPARPSTCGSRASTRPATRPSTSSTPRRCPRRRAASGSPSRASRRRRARLRPDAPASSSKTSPSGRRSSRSSCWPTGSSRWARSPRASRTRSTTRSCT